MKKLFFLSGIALSVAVLSVAAGKVQPLLTSATDKVAGDTAAARRFVAASNQLYRDTIPEKKDTVKKDTTSKPH